MLESLQFHNNKVSLSNLKRHRTLFYSEKKLREIITRKPTLPQIIKDSSPSRNFRATAEERKVSDTPWRFCSCAVMKKEEDYSVRRIGTYL